MSMRLSTRLRSSRRTARDLITLEPLTKSHRCSHSVRMLDAYVTVPAQMLERLVYLVATALGNANVPALLLFAEVRRLIEQAKRAGQDAI